MLFSALRCASDDFFHKNATDGRVWHVFPANALNTLDLHQITNGFNNRPKSLENNRREREVMQQPQSGGLGVNNK